MKLYLMRHGEYLVGTAEEALSAPGKVAIKEQALLLQKTNSTVGKIWHSGKRRALETAEIIAKGFAGNIQPALRPGLKPNDDPSQFAADLSLIEDDVMIVSHLPFLARLVGLLMVRNENRELIDFQPGTIACLEQVDREKWLIQWVWNKGL